MDTFELAFPNLTYAGYHSDHKKHAHAITFKLFFAFSFPWKWFGLYRHQWTCESHFYANTQSQTYTGFGDVNIPFRWGDYTGIASRWPGEVWTAGYYIRADGNNSSWLSQLKVGDNPLLGLHQTENPDVLPWKMFPNPARGHFQVEIEVPEAGIYSFELFTIQGKKIRTLLKDKLWRGKARLDFFNFCSF